MSKRISDRNRAFQQSVDPDLIQLKRDEHNIELRKTKRYELSRKRRMSQVSKNQSVPSAEFLNSHPYFQGGMTDKQKILENCLVVINENSPIKFITEALQITRVLLNQVTEEDIDLYVDLGFIPLYLSFLDQKYPKEIQYEASFALCNISSYDHKYIELLIQNGTIQSCVDMITNHFDETAENCM